MEGIGRRIRSLRVLHGMNQEDLAEKLGVSISTVSGWEKDVYEPSLKFMWMLCDLFHITPNNLLGIGKQEADLPDEQDRFMLSVYKEQMPGKVKDIIRDIASYVHEQFSQCAEMYKFKQKVYMFICKNGLETLWDAYENESASQDGDITSLMYRRNAMKEFLTGLLQTEFPTESNEITDRELSEVGDRIDKFEKEERDSASRMNFDIHF